MTINILITGISGQDGLYLTKNLLESKKNVNIFGLSRSIKEDLFFSRLSSISNNFNQDKVKIFSLNYQDYDQVNNLIKEVKPDILFNMTGPSSVYKSFYNPKIYRFSIEILFENIVNSLISNNNLCTFIQAGSSEMFDSSAAPPYNLDTNMKPRSPYAESKKVLHEKVIKLRNELNWDIKNAVLFNHESEFRDENYLFQKIILHSLRAKKNLNTKLELGSLDMARDWSFAGDITKGMINFAFSKVKEDLIFASGQENNIKQLVELISELSGINILDNIQINEQLLRSGDPISSYADTNRTFETLNWETKKSFEDLVLYCFKKQNNFLN